MEVKRQNHLWSKLMLPVAFACLKMLLNKVYRVCWVLGAEYTGYAVYFAFHPFKNFPFTIGCHQMEIVRKPMLLQV